MLNSYYREVATRARITVSYGTALREFDLEGPRLPRCGGPPRRRRVSRRYQGGDLRLGRIRGKPGMATPVLGRRRGQLHHSGHTVQRRTRPGSALWRQGSLGRADHRLPRHCCRRPRTQVRRRDLHAAGHHPVWLGTEQTRERFYGESEEIWPKRSAIWGTHIASGRPDHNSPGKPRWMGCSYH